MASAKRSNSSGRGQERSNEVPLPFESNHYHDDFQEKIEFLNLHESRVRLPLARSYRFDWKVQDGVALPVLQHPWAKGRVIHLQSLWLTPEGRCIVRGFDLERCETPPENGHHREPTGDFEVRRAAIYRQFRRCLQEKIDKDYIELVTLAPAIVAEAEQRGDYDRARTATEDLAGAPEKKVGFEAFLASLGGEEVQRSHVCAARRKGERARKVEEFLQLIETQWRDAARDGQELVALPSLGDIAKDLKVSPSTVGRVFKKWFDKLNTNDLPPWLFEKIGPRQGDIARRLTSGAWQGWKSRKTGHTDARFHDEALSDEDAEPDDFQ